MTIRRRMAGASPIPGLTTAQVDVLLTGTSVDDPFLEFDIHEREWAALWQEFGAQLRAEAQRRGIRMQELEQRGRANGSDQESE